MGRTTERVRIHIPEYRINGSVNQIDPDGYYIVKLDQYLFLPSEDEWVDHLKVAPDNIEYIEEGD